MKTLTLSKPMNPSRRKPRQRITRAEIVSKTPLLGGEIDHTEHSEPVSEPSEPELTTNQATRELKDRYPVIAEGKPLAIGISKVIRRKTKWKRALVNRAVKTITSHPAYIADLAAEDSRRFNLDGSDAGEVKDSHRLHAQRLLDKRTKKKRPRQSEAFNESGQDSVTTQRLRDG